MRKEILYCVTKLNECEIILYPTDTVWGIGCDATNEIAVAKIYGIKEREESKSLVILVNNIEMLKHYVNEIPKSLIDIIKKATKPTTVIL